ncbi:MAG: hypothetical protein PVI40_00525 [Chlamydiota bacterium]|jgi:hypothetical protein
MAAVNNQPGALADIEFDWDNTPQAEGQSESVRLIRRVETAAKEGVSSVISQTNNVVKGPLHASADACCPDAVASVSKVGTDAVLVFFARKAETQAHQHIESAANLAVEIAEVVEES